MRRLAFALAVIALGAVLVLVGLRSSHSIPGAASTDGPADRHPVASGPRPATRPPPKPGALRQARRFLDAFLSQEVGPGATRTEKEIRAGASHAFADQILEQPRAKPGLPDPGAARIASLRLDRVPGRPDLALVSGEARRPAGPEPFAFLFARRHGRWLAVAPGE